MAFRDELGAAQARADALARENRALRAELERLKNPAVEAPEEAPEAEAPLPPVDPARRGRVVRLVAAVAVVEGLAIAVGLAVAPAIALVAVVLAAATIIAILVVASLMVAPLPDQIVVLSGRRTRGPDGQERGYLVVTRPILRRPFLETIARIDARPARTPIAVDNAYTRGGVPLDARGLATVRVTRGPGVDHAVERFLGRPRAEIARVAAETLEGHLRDAMAGLTPDEIGHDPDRFADAVAAAAAADLARLGLDLDALAIAPPGAGT